MVPCCGRLGDASSPPTKSFCPVLATSCSYDHNGRLVGQAGAARTVGTTVAVRELFKRLPVRCGRPGWLLGAHVVPLKLRYGQQGGGMVARSLEPPACPVRPERSLLLSLGCPALCRHKEFLRHIKREYARLVGLLQAYALIW